MGAGLRGCVRDDGVTGLSSVPTQSEQTENSTTKQDQVRHGVLGQLTAAHLTAGGAFMYAIGFVVSNVHFARFELLRFELLQARYLGAAFLFALVAGLPMLAGLFSTHEFVTTAQTPKRAAWAVVGGMALGTGITVALAWIPDLAVGEHNPGNWAVFGFAASEFGRRHYLMWASRPSDKTSKGLSSFSSSLTWTHLALLTMVAVLMMAAIFGRLLYPQISPAFGGGAVWLARVHVHGEVTSITSLTAGNVAVLERDISSVNVIVCRDQKELITLQLPSEQVEFIEIRGLLALPADKKQLCNADHVGN